MLPVLFSFCSHVPKKGNGHAYISFFPETPGKGSNFFYRNHKLKCSLEFIKYAIIKLLNELEDFLIAALLSFLYREHERRIQKRRQQIDFTSQAFYAHGDLRIGLKDGAETWRNHSLF